MHVKVVSLQGKGLQQRYWYHYIVGSTSNIQQLLLHFPSTKKMVCCCCSSTPSELFWTHTIPHNKKNYAKTKTIRDINMTMWIHLTTPDYIDINLLNKNNSRTYILHVTSRICTTSSVYSLHIISCCCCCCCFRLLFYWQEYNQCVLLVR